MKYDIKEWSGNLKIRITLDNGKEYDIQTGEGSDFVQINSIDGRMVIHPSVSNVIKITSE